MYRNIQNEFPEPKQSTFKPNRKKVIKALKDSISPATENKPRGREGHYSMINGKFQVFKILHGHDVIFVIDNERCEELDLQAVCLEGIRGSTVCRIRNIGSVEGQIRSDAPVYKIDDQCLGLRRVNGNTKTTKEKK
jgi:hypothetical protein